MGTASTAALPRTHSAVASGLRSGVVTVFLVAFGFCAVLTKTDVQGNADASRIATVQALVEDRSFVIDASQAAGSELVTVDKYVYDGHFYSEKPPLPALAGAVVYSWSRLVGVTFDAHPGWAYYLVTLFTVGLATAAGLACLYRLLAGMMGVDRRWAAVVTFVAGGATILLSYSVAFNNHVICASLLLIGYSLIRSATLRQLPDGAADVAAGGDRGDPLEQGSASRDAVWAGVILSLAVLSDFSCIVFLPFLLVGYGRAHWRRAAITAAVCVPWIVAYLALNVALSGTLRPPATNPSLFEYPGSIFNAQNLSGVTGQDSVGSVLRYAFSIFLGRRGLLSHSPVLIFSLIGAVVLWRRGPSRDRLAVLAALAGSALFMATFTVRTIDLGGYAYSARWFVEAILLLCLPLAFIDRSVRSSSWFRRAFVVVTSVSIALAFIGTVSPYTDDHLGVVLPGGFVARYTAIVNADLLLHGDRWLIVRTATGAMVALALFGHLLRAWLHDGDGAVRPSAAPLQEFEGWYTPGG